MDTFDSLHLPYLITGSTATIVYGEPRFTNDIDVVLDLPFSKVNALLAAFPATEYYVSLAAVEMAILDPGMFKIIHPASGLKVDVMVASDSEFDRMRLSRGRALPVLPDRSVWFASPEDVILKKLEYYREGGSDKHLRDIAGVLKLQGDRIDRSHIEQWAL
ncbi:MAG: hypothetical protein U1D30_20225 [Planctomycetota bacterium]